MTDKKKLIGLIGLVVTTTISTVMTTWMSDKEIEKKVNEALAEREKNEEES